MIVPIVVFGDDASEIADVAAAVNGCIAVQGFAPFAGSRQADTIFVARHWSKIKNDDELADAIRILPKKREDAALVIGGINPREAAGIKIGLPEARLGEIKLIQPLDIFLHAAMVRSGVEQPPFQFAIGVPFTALAELAAHEEEHFAGEKPLISEEHP